MTPLYDTQEFYKKMLQLQERLRKSEDERMKLEERFNILSQDFRSRRETCINNLRMRYIDFLEEQRLRDERNHQILGALDKIDGSLARMTARTDRLGILRKQYEAYLLRVYANRNTEGGTGDSGVGSHNEDRSPKINILPTEKNVPQSQRIVTQNVGNPLSFIPQTKYPRSHIGASDISQFNFPRYTPGQETSQVHVLPANSKPNASTIVQPQLFYESQNRSIPNTSVSQTQLMPNVSQEFIPPSQSYPEQFRAEQFLRSNNQQDPNYAQVQHRQLHDISNQYLGNSRLPYADEPSMVRSQKLPNSQGMISSDLQFLSGSQPNTSNGRTMGNFSAGLNDETTFDPYRQSTPLPGYLDYSTRYSRDPPVNDPNVAFRYGFTRSDLEKVIDKNKPILPHDYLHNSETVKPPTETSKLSSHLEDKQRVSDAKLSRALNDGELDQYISRIRSLHRDNDHSLEALDIEQNTSGDLLNATLSDDGPELTLHSGDKIKSNEGRMVSDAVKGVLALADDFVAETGNLGAESQYNSELLSDHKVPSKSVFSSQMRGDNVGAKPTFNETNDGTPALLKAEMASDNLSNSVTRNDILSGTASVGVNQMQDTSAIANGKIRPKITPPIADIDTPRLNPTDVATVSKINLVDPKGFRPNESDDHQVLSSSSQEYLKMLEKRSNLDNKVNSEQRPLTEVPSSRIQSVTKDYGLIPKKTEVHEDIEGDKVSLIEGEQIPEQVIDVIRELQPPSLQHYEKNIVEIHVGDENKKDANTRKVVLDDVAGPKIEGTEDAALRKDPGGVNVAETVSQESVAKQIYTERDVTDQKYSGAEQTEYQDDIEPKYESNPDQEYEIHKNESGQILTQDADGNRNAGQMFEQNPEHLYDPGTIEQLNYDTRQPDEESSRFIQPDNIASDEPYETNQSDVANRQYETDPGQQYVQEHDSQFAYDSTPHFEDDLNRQYGVHPNEHYAANPNEQYGVDPNEQYAADPNALYEADPNEQYSADPNEQYAANPNEQYLSDPNEQYIADPNEQYTSNPNEQYTDESYAVDPNEQYAADRNEQYAADPNQRYATDQNEQYAVDPNQRYAADPNEQYAVDPNQRYAAADPNEQYLADPNEQYSNVSNEHYRTGPNEGYEADPNEQYSYYQNQPYPDDQNATGENTGNEHYNYDADQDYQRDPNQQYEHEQYEHGQYEQNNESSVQDPNQEYGEHEYGQNQSSEFADYEEPKQGSNQQFANDSQKNYAGLNLELESSGQGYPAVTAGEQNEIQAVTGDSDVRDLSGPDNSGTEEYSADGKMKKKDVIRALLESDTESTIERDPSNNTESDFNFN